MLDSQQIIIPNSSFTLIPAESPGPAETPDWVTPLPEPAREFCHMATRRFD